MESVRGEGEYWCHQCNRRVRCSRDNGQDIYCPLCHGGFLEELESHVQELRDAVQANLPNVDPRLIQHLNYQTNPTANPGGGNSLVQLLDTLVTTLQGLYLNNNNNSNEVAASMNANANDPSQATVVFQRRVLNLPIETATLGPGGLQVVFENRGDGTQTNLPGTFGDFFIGPGLDTLIQHLGENDTNRHGSPPASKASIEAMPTFQITEQDVSSDHSPCAVCRDDFLLGDSVRQLPCKHIYHPHCILPWFELHSTCPVCRYEMPAGDSNDNIDNSLRSNQQEEIGSAAPGTNLIANERDQGGVFSMLDIQGVRNGSLEESTALPEIIQVGQPETAHDGGMPFSISSPRSSDALFSPTTLQSSTGSFEITISNTVHASNLNQNATAAQSTEENAFGGVVLSSSVDDLD